MTPRIALALLALAVALPATLSAKVPAAARPSAARGLAFAKGHCAACHGIAANKSSANPEAPPWDDIANRPGTTQLTLRQFLTDSHNFPEAMKFTVKPKHIRDLAAYLVTLQKPDYKPGI